jgi:transposase-like protein
VVHRRARLTPFGRLLLVSRIVEQGWSVPAAAGSLGVSRATAHKWVKRFRDEGLDGLEDRSSAPRRRPRALAQREVERILRARRRLKVGPHRLGPELGHARSTVSGSYGGTACLASRTSIGRRRRPCASSGTGRENCCMST